MRVIVGRVGRPHGVRGEVAIWVRTDEPELRFAAGAAMDAHRDLPADPGGAPGSFWSRSPASRTGPRPGS